MWSRVLRIPLIVLVLTATNATAQETERKWGISPYLGLYEPKLEQLNKGEFLAPHEGSADIINPSGNNTVDDFRYDSPLPPFDPGALAGNQ
jgi:hypothetical protein